MACEHLCLQEHNNKDIHIHVDNHGALQSLVKLQITSKTVQQTVDLLRELAVCVCVCDRIFAGEDVPGDTEILYLVFIALFILD
jgi:hypothetical protein